MLASLKERWNFLKGIGSESASTAPPHMNPDFELNL
jgi:hypothetical protein